jgi:hippurate hydrolase
MKKILAALLSALLVYSIPVSASELNDSVKIDYDEYLAELWDHFHQNPELSLVEFKTAERMAAELRAAGFDVTEGVGGTGVVAMLENGDGPLVMMCTLRASLAPRGRCLRAKTNGVAHSCWLYNQQKSA